MVTVAGTRVARGIARPGSGRAVCGQGRERASRGVVEGDTSEPRLKPGQIRAFLRSRVLPRGFLHAGRDRSAHFAGSGVGAVREPPLRINPRTSMLTLGESI